MIEIEINNKIVKIEKHRRLIDVCDELNIDIPRFCYHKDLSVAANCRMCLVEIDSNQKMQPACSTLVEDGMKISTNSDKVKSSQKAVMELLLINHPLDCPICDQGGECELQDVAIKYGANKTFFHEEKRVVTDKNVGDFIQTDMTRCIHCTRCVRFGKEIAGVAELGAINRGDNLEISTFLSYGIESELSGNMIDICPVGALTSKPYRFSIRSWEMQNFPGIARHDALGSNINIQTFNNKVYRISSKKNQHVNGSWISDIDRFSYLSLHNNRLLDPKIKVEGEYKITSWDNALDFAIKNLKNNVITNNQGHKLAVIADKTATTEELYLLKLLATKLGSNNVESFTIKGKNYSYLNSTVTTSDINKFDNIIIIGGSIRNDEPIINSFIKKVVDEGAKVTIFSGDDVDVNYESKIVKVTNYNFIDVLEKLATDSESLIILGDEINKINNLQYFNYLLRSKFKNILNLSVGGNVNASKSLNFECENIYEMSSYILFNIDKNNINSELLDSINKANFVISFSVFTGNEELANIMLPIAGLYETSGSFININNFTQYAAKAVSPPNNVKEGWKVIKVLADLLQLDGFDFTTITELKQLAVNNLRKQDIKADTIVTKKFSMNNKYEKQLDSFIRNTSILFKRFKIKKEFN